MSETRQTTPKCAAIVLGHPKYYRYGEQCTRRGVVQVGGHWYCRPHAAKLQKAESPS